MDEEANLSYSSLNEMKKILYHNELLLKLFVTVIFVFSPVRGRSDWRRMHLMTKVNLTYTCPRDLTGPQLTHQVFFSFVFSHSTKHKTVFEMKSGYWFTSAVNGNKALTFIF